MALQLKMTKNIIQFKESVAPNSKTIHKGGRNSVPSLKIQHSNQKKIGNRNKRILIDLLDCNITKNSYLVTLSFNKNTSRETAMDKYQNFMQSLNLKSGYVTVPEYTHRERIHFHIVFFSVKNIKKNMLINKWKTNGYIDIKPIEQYYAKHNPSISVGMYLSKNFHEQSFSKRYYSSKNLKKPKLFHNSELISILLSTIESKQILTLKNVTYSNIYSRETKISYSCVNSEEKKYIGELISEILWNLSK